MNGKRIWAVIKREVRVRLGKGFILATALIPVLMCAIVGIQVLLANMKGPTRADVTIAIQRNAGLERLVRKALDQAVAAESATFRVRYVQVDSGEFARLLKRESPALLKDSAKSLFYIPETATTDKQVQLYSANPGNMDVRTKVGAAINTALNLSFFGKKGIAEADLKFVQSEVAIRGNKIMASGTQVEGWGPAVVGFGLALMLLFGIIFNAMPMMSTIVGEKASRIYEVLLSSVRPAELMWGKIIGAAVTATLQMLIWVASFVVLAALLNNFVDLSQSLHLDMKPLVLAYYVVNYVTGLLIFLTLYGGFSAVFDDQSAASTALVPVFLLILLPFYTVFSLASNPANSVSQVLSMLPFTSLYVMPARMSLIDVPAWQPLLALAVNIAVLYVATTVAGKVYRLAVLSTGNNPSLRQLIVWAKQS